MTLEAETLATTQAGWQGRSLAWLAYVDNLSLARISETAHAAAETLEVPSWPRSHVGTIAYIAAVTGFIALTIAMKGSMLAGGLLILPVYLFLVGLVACVALPRRAD